MKVSELAERAGIAPSAVRWYESVGIIPPAARQPNGYRAFAEDDLARLRLVVSLRRLGLGPEDAGRMARLCLEQGEVDRDLAPLIADQRAAIARQRDDLDRLDGELLDLEGTIAAAGRARGRRRPVPEEPIRVLFVCTGNSARSQIAEAVLGRLGGADFEVHSAGTEPKGVNPFTVQILDSAGFDWSGARSQSVDEFAGQSFDYVITVCDRARQTCPTFPGSQNRLHWGLDDPAEVEGSDAERLGAFQRTYTEVNQRVRPFVEVALRAAGRGRTATLAG
ncbi:MAG TPA: MerR family transcriptional regulator [Patescibacteria group bacterium]|nr:MerR family transcriptional regulator [Patescibacteria group bacterium]